MSGKEYICNLLVFLLTYRKKDTEPVLSKCMFGSMQQLELDFLQDGLVSPIGSAINTLCWQLFERNSGVSNVTIWIDHYQ